MRVVFSGCRGDGRTGQLSTEQKLPYRIENRADLLQLEDGAKSFHHGVFLVMLHQVCEGVELLSSPHVVLQVTLGKDARVTFVQVNVTLL